MTLLMALDSCLLTQITKLFTIKALCQNIGNHFFCWTVLQLDRFVFDQFSHKMILNVTFRDAADF